MLAEAESFLGPRFGERVTFEQANALTLDMDRLADVHLQHRHVSRFIW